MRSAARIALRLAAALGVLALVQHPQWMAAPQAVTRGDEALHSGNPAAAFDAYLAALRIHPGDPSIIERLSDAARVASRPEIALSYLNLLGTKVGWTPPLYRAAASLFEAQGDEAAALAYWTASLTGSAEDLPALHRIAAWQLAGREWDAALETFYRILSLSPDDPDTVYRIGLLLAPANPRRAVEYLESAAPDHPAAKTLLAIYRDYGSEPPSAINLRIGLALMTAYEWPYAERALAASAASEARPVALAFLGLAQDQQGRDGWPLLSRAREDAPNDPLVHYAVGVHWRLKGDFTQALAALIEARALDPGNAGIAAEIGLVYQDSGYLGEAAQWLGRAAALAPDDAGIRKLQATFYADESYDLRGEGLQIIRAAVERAPNDPDLRASLGWALLSTGQYAAARDELQEALTLDPNNPRARFYFAVYLEYQGDTESAIDSYLFVYRVDRGGLRERAARALQRLGYQIGGQVNPG